MRQSLIMAALTLSSLTAARAAPPLSASVGRINPALVGRVSIDPRLSIDAVALLRLEVTRLLARTDKLETALAATRLQLDAEQSLRQQMQSDFAKHQHVVNEIWGDGCSTLPDYNPCSWVITSGSPGSRTTTPPVLPK